ncbi:SET domain-containing protein [Trinickia violacea]|uniref:SET domain-containing protein n=1 Tax=Trinickia violacea TaxID=2571746 RepID=A0A4P8IPT8_9BURK|nr:SET domain-containing protein-lysine N-methyltransferase [Trinickia violacea]QCP49043.1 SET domain-containing protein [Trinickia violacea]
MRRVVVRRSPVHGKGVFALRQLAAGERVLEYAGEVTSWRKAAGRLRRNGMVGHTFVFGLSDGRVIDGSRGGNSARWLNHACVANCEAIEEDGRVFIETLTDIDAGAELFIRYGLTVDGAITDEIRAQYSCYCGASICTRTMLDDAA